MRQHRKTSVRAIQISKTTLSNIIKIVIATIICFALISVYAFNVVESGYCINSNSRLTNFELRAQAIKSLLLIKINTQHRFGDLYELSVIKRAVSKQEIISRISETTITSLVNYSSHKIKATTDIDALEDIIRGTEFSIITYSKRARSLEIIPGDSIKALSDEEVVDYYKYRDLNFGLIDKLGGVRRVFSVTVYGDIGLACCDEQGNKDGLPPNWHAKNSIKTILAREGGDYASHLIASNCGEILKREHDGEQIYIFP